MARTRWLHYVAGTSFVLTMGCQTPHGPGSIRTLDGAGGPASVSGPRFPVAPTPGAPAAKSTTAPLPAPNMPVIDEAPMKIGPPAAQAGQVTTPGVPKLRPFDPSTGAAVPPNNAFPPAHPGADNALRNLSSADFNDWNPGEPKSAGPAHYSPVPGQQTGMPAQMPPPPMTSLPNGLQAGGAVPIAPPNVTMPQVNMPALPSMPTPTFPASPAFPSPPAMPNASLQPNLPAAPNLSPPGASRQTIYPGTNP